MNSSVYCTTRTALLNPSFYEKLSADTWMSLITLYSGNMTYPNYRSDPVFPALSPGPSPYTQPRKWKSSYHNNRTAPAVLGCIDLTEICDKHLNLCWPAPRRSSPRTILNTQHGVAGSKSELARVLLETSLTDSSICSSLGRRGIGTPALEAESYCSYYACNDLPEDQWKVEVRRWFEASLARIQINTLEVVRGTGNYGDDYDGIPPGWRGICQMGKFKSVGWRNVSVWGFLGLLAIAGGVTVASFKTKEEELWLVLGARGTVRAFGRAFVSLKSIRWASFWERLFSFSSL